MITRFGSLFAGHVDMDNVGLEGTAVNDRWFSDDHLATIFDKTLAMAKCMDDMGFDVIWLAEHHFQREGYECIPNIMLFAMEICHRTKNIKVGSGFNITTMWHPLRLAEDFAIVDHLTKGRVIFGVGRGYHTREVEVFGNPLLDQDANRELFEEQVDLIFKSFNEQSFSHHGKHYEIPPKVPYRGYELEEITLVPRPRTLPVDCYQPVVSASPRGLNFMAKHGIKAIIGGGVAPGGASENVARSWQETLAQHGRETELGGDSVFGFSFHIAETEEKAIREAEKYYFEDMKMFAPLNMVRGLSDEQIVQLGDPKAAPAAGLPGIEGAAKAGEWLCGTPEMIIEKLMRVQEQYPGLEEIHVGHGIGTPQAVIVEQLQRFGEEVMPAFKSQVKTAATPGS